MVDAGENGLVWTTETLYRFIASPRKTLPGTKMAFAGIRTHEERSNIVAYLRTPLARVRTSGQIGALCSLGARVLMRKPSYFGLFVGFAYCFLR